MRRRSGVFGRGWAETEAGAQRGFTTRMCPGGQAPLLDLDVVVAHVAPAVPRNDEMLHPRLHDIAVIKAEHRHPGGILVDDLRRQILIDLAARLRVGHAARFLDRGKDLRIVVVVGTRLGARLREEGVEEVVGIVEIGRPDLGIGVGLARLARGKIGCLVGGDQMCPEPGLGHLRLNDLVHVGPARRPARHLLQVDVDPVRIAGLGQKFLGLGGVVFDRRRRGIAGQPARHHAILELAPAIEVLVEDGLPVDRHLERLAHSDVVEGLLRLVDVVIVDADARPRDDMILPLLRAVEIGRLGRGVIHVEHVDLVGFEQHPQRLGVRDHADQQPVELGPSAPVLVIRLEHLAVVQRIIAQDERTGAVGGFRRQTELVARGLGEGAVVDRGTGRRQQRKKGGIGLGQGDLDRLVIERLQARHAGGLAVEPVLGAGDEGQDVGAQRFGRGVQHPIEGVDHVIGGQLRAVVEFHALAQMERIGQPVVRDVPAFGQTGNQCRLPRPGGFRFHQPVEDVQRQRVEIRRHLRIGAFRIVEIGYAQHVLGQRGRQQHQAGQPRGQ
ncbi:hypothetical protein SDC9_48673 [bioreactor metagenome]|uniref:Uncharacterized protein n=1 Tax=bioreactor metagenome TaxID=1076179 RepID=A0A644WJJ4_9ZZZZ